VLNLGTLFFGFIFFAVSLVFLVLFKVLSRIKFFDKAYNSLHSLLFWNAMIRFILESYLELVIASFVNIGDLYWDNPSNVMASLFSVAFVAITFLFPIFVSVFLYKKYSVLDCHDTESKYGALYEGVRN